MLNNQPSQPVGVLLRDWRQRRRLSQLGLACEADISARHLSFVETGRALPSREMILHLAAQLEIPLRERNALLVAAGYAPMYGERSLEDPTLQAARQVVDLLLAGHEPFPAMAVDRHWNLVAANRAIVPLFNGVDASLLAPPVNVLRLSLHPLGVASRIVNLAAWRDHVFHRLGRQIEVSGDLALVDLREELKTYPAPTAALAPAPVDYGGVAMPLQFATEHGVLSLLSTITVFGTPVDITLSELALETFFPADTATYEILMRTFNREA
ncbi:MAG: helix-turn-helix transcriptional regulator [Blastocatellia bacterium]|nr:helix-turn-helix transcriptional regulator [Blastocatellia bacterium]